MTKGVVEAEENPLVPNAKLKQMYKAMLEARELDQAVQNRARIARRRGALATIAGQEAVRVSTAIELGAEDLVSDVVTTAGMAMILGGDPAALLKRFSKPLKGRGSRLRSGERMLPQMESARATLQMALGAAAGLKAQGRKGIVVAYAAKGEIATAAWRRVLETASRLELPVIFVVLPAKGMKKTDRLEASRAARLESVPAMPVDACDAVALYRVTQESLGRTRSGDGPVLIECVTWRPGGRRSELDDPIEHLERFLLEKKIATPEWFAKARNAARKVTKRKGPRG